MLDEAAATLRVNDRATATRLISEAIRALAPDGLEAPGDDLGAALIDALSPYDRAYVLLAFEDKWQQAEASGMGEAQAAEHAANAMQKEEGCFLLPARTWLAALQRQERRIVDLCGEKMPEWLDLLSGATGVSGASILQTAVLLHLRTVDPDHPDVKESGVLNL